MHATMGTRLLQREKLVSIFIIVDELKSMCERTFRAILVWSQSDIGFIDLEGGELVA